MCGITGLVSLTDNVSPDDLRNQIEKINDTLVHRGPDSGNVWVDEAGRIALGHRRLSIQDLSLEGQQPMISKSGRYQIVYNGEIYNFMEIMAELESMGWTFRGHSDTEVLLASIEEWGLDQAVHRSNGMWSFVIWDKKERKLILSRDRIGKKPLYFGTAKGYFVFASELKAIRSIDGYRPTVDRDSLALLMRYDYIPSPYSIYKNIYKLPAASILKIDVDKIRQGMSYGELTKEIKTYWSLSDVCRKAEKNKYQKSENELLDELDLLLRDAVKIRSISDVPLGVFLSGGIDSSLVTAAMQQTIQGDAKTFSIGVKNKEYNEAIFAKEVAKHLGTEHTEHYVSPEESLSVIKLLPTLYDEPFADSSQIPMHLVSKMAKQYVTVCLTGDGGDESFGGYYRYYSGKKIWDKIGLMPNILKKIVGKITGSISPAVWGSLFRVIEKITPRKFHINDPEYKIQALSEVLMVNNREEFYRWTCSHWKNPESLVLGSREPLTVFSDPSRQAGLLDFSEEMMFIDQASYLPDDLLVKADRATMGSSLEARSPLLDHRIIEFAWSLPMSYRIQNDDGKRLLKKLLYRYMPRKLVDRPKMGFSIPVEAWLRGPLKEWAESLIDKERLKKEGFFDPELVHKKWQEHQSGKKDWKYSLWNVLMFQAWYESNF